MFKKRVTIFGRSIPVAVILLALLVVGAAAWGIYVSTLGIRGSTAAVPNFEWTAADGCTTPAGVGSGVASLSGGEPIITVSDVEPGSQIRCVFYGTVDGPDIEMLPLPPEQNGVYVTSLAVGNLLASGTTDVTLAFIAHFTDNLQPGTINSDFDVQFDLYTP